MVELTLDSWLTFHLFKLAKQSENKPTPSFCPNCNKKLTATKYNLDEYFTKGFLHKYCQKCGFNWTKRILSS